MVKRHPNKRPKRIPSFWWDFRYEPDEIIVESDDQEHKVVKRWKGHAQRHIDRAIALVDDLREGRADYRKQS